MKLKRKTIYEIIIFLVCLMSQSVLAEDVVQQAIIEGNKGRELWQQQQYKQAMKHFEKAAELDPSTEEYFSNAAICAIQNHEPLRAVIFLKNAINACIPKKDFQRIQEFNEQISNALNIWPSWAEQKYEAAAALPETAEIVKAQQHWYELMTQVQNSFNPSDPKVIDMLIQAITIAKKHFGMTHPETLNSQKMLAEIYMDTGNLESALAIFIQVADDMVKPLNALHPLRVGCLLSIAMIYDALEKYDEAEKYYLESNNISKQSMGVDHPETMIRMYTLAMFYVNQMKYQKAIELFKEVVPLYQLQYGLTHPETLSCMDDFAMLYKSQANTAAAEPLLLSIAENRILIYGDHAVETLNTQMELGDLYRQKAAYDEAASLLKTAIANAQELSVSNAQLFYNLKTELARVYEDMGHLDEAQKLMEIIHAFDLNTLGKNHPNTLTDLSHIASILRKKGELQKAEKLFAQVYNDRKAIYGEKHPAVIIDLNNLALVFEDQGLYDQAEPLLKKASHLAESVLGTQHTTTLATMNNLALLHESQGVFKRATPLYIKTIRAYTGLLGEDHPNTIAAINNLAYLYMLEKNYTDALERFKRVFEGWKKRLTINHQNTLKAMNNLGRVYHKMGNLDQASSLLHQALELRVKNLGETHMDAIRSSIDVAALYISQKKFKPGLIMIKKAVDFSTASLGPHHPYTFEALNVQARLFEKMNNQQKAIQTYELIFNRRNQFFERVLWATGENARNGYIHLHQHEQDTYMSLLAESKSPDSAQKILNISLQRKGLLLKVASEIEQVTQMLDKPELNAISQNLMEKKKTLAALTLSGPSATSPQQFLLDIEKLENEIEELQGELGRASIRFRTIKEDLTPEIIVNRLGGSDIFLDYISFMNLKLNKRQLAAIVAQQDETGKSVFNKIIFEDMDLVDQWVNNYREIIQDEDMYEDEIQEEGRLLYERIWLPLVDYFNEKTSIYMVPDGMLNILPFDALVDEDNEYIIQTYDIKILSSGRDLLLSVEKPSQSPFLIIAGPDYDSEYLVETEVVKDIKRKRSKRGAESGKRNADLLKGLRMASFGMRGLSFSPLPGAEREGQEIDALCNKERSTQLYLKNQAEEYLLRNMKQAPDILHIATHGFFLKSQEKLTKRLVKLQRSMDPMSLIPPPGDNPLLRAGLAFAGINQNAQFLGEIDTDNDGVLTAIEVLGLKLYGTRMVVLSACETGLGEVHVGEGVYGLRRAFQEAGARTVINSLWEVSDKGTQQLMTGLYKNILKGMPVREAFRQAQLDMKNSIMWSHPYIWSAFFMVGR